MLQGDDDADATLRACSSVHGPALEQENEETCTVKLTCYDLRGVLAARDPRAVVEAFTVEIRTSLPWLLGIRMCPHCPHCNAEGSKNPCQNRFGSNMLPVGGTLAGVSALDGAVEFQKKNTPHFHGGQRLSIQNVAGGCGYDRAEAFRS